MFGCFFAHKFPKWSEPTEIVLSGRRLQWGKPVTDWEDYRMREQHRTCERCGEYQQRVIKPDGSVA